MFSGWLGSFARVEDDAMLANKYDLFTGVEAIAELQGSPRFITDE
jgi:hypothetical protein